MKVLGIYGASGHGREVLELAHIINKTNKQWDDFIFIDDGDVPEIVSECKVFKYEEARRELSSSLEVVMGIGEPATREKLFKKLKNDGINTPSLIHPEVYIPQSTTIGKGVVIQYGCFVSCNVSIADYVYIQPQCNIGHDDILEEGCMIAGLGNIGGIVHIGKWTYIGLSVAIKQLINIGEYSIIGMGAVVLKDIEDGVTAVGNPARVIARNEERRVFKG